MHVGASWSVLLWGVVVVAIAGGGDVEAAWIPGFTPQVYHDGDILPLLQSRVSPQHSPSKHASTLTTAGKHQAHVYAYADLPIACPASPRYPGSSSRIPLTLAQIARGDRVSVSSHELVFGIDEENKLLCTLELEANALRRTKDLISQRYREEWILDGLPGVRAWRNTTGSGRYFGRGVEIGEEIGGASSGDVMRKGEPSTYEIYNHVSLLVRYRTLGRKQQRDALLSLPETHWEEEIKKLQATDWERVIVGFELFPKSRKTSTTMKQGIAEKRVQIWPIATSTASRMPKEGKKQQAAEGGKLKIPFTYSVYWREEVDEDKGGIEWGDRWKPYSSAEEEVETTLHYKFSLWLCVVLLLLGYWLCSVWMSNLEEKEGGANLLSNPIHATQTQRPRNKGKPKKNYGLLSQPHIDTKARSSPSSDEEEDLHSNAQHRQPSPLKTYQTTFLPAILAAGIQILALLITIFPLYALKALHVPYFSHFLTLSILILLTLIPFSGYVSLHSSVASSYANHASSSPARYPSFSYPLSRQNLLLTTCTLPALLFAATWVVNLNVWWQAGGTVIPFPTLTFLCGAWVMAQGVLVYTGMSVARNELADVEGNTHNTIHQALVSFTSPRTSPTRRVLKNTNNNNKKTPRNKRTKAKQLIYYTLTSLLPFATSHLATKLLTHATSCTITNLHTKGSILRLSLSTTLTLTCNTTTNNNNNNNTSPSSSSPTATNLLNTTLHTTTFILTLLLISFFSTHAHQPTPTTKTPLPPLLRSSLPSLPFTLTLLSTALANPLRPAGVVPLVLQAAWVGLVGVAFAVACVAVGACGVGLRVWVGRGG